MFSDASWLQPFLMCSCLSFGGVYGNAVTLLQRLSIRPAAPELNTGVLAHWQRYCFRN